MATATKTKTITETHLLVATAILLSAAGLAFLIAPISPTSSLCADSDGGYNLAVKGTTKGYDAATGKTVQRTDACVSAKPTAITEYSCKGSNVVSANASCPTGQVCSDGACIVKYVATWGNDTDNDGSSARPWRTIQYAIDQLPAGGKIFVLEGRFNEQIRISKSITIEGAGTDKTTIAKAEEGSTIIEIANAPHVILQNLRISGMESPGSRASEGIYVENGSITLRVI